MSQTKGGVREREGERIRGGGNVDRRGRVGWSVWRKPGRRGKRERLKEGLLHRHFCLLTQMDKPEFRLGPYYVKQASTIFLRK